MPPCDPWNPPCPCHSNRELANCCSPGGGADYTDMEVAAWWNHVCRYTDRREFETDWLESQWQFIDELPQRLRRLLLEDQGFPFIESVSCFAAIDVPVRGASPAVWLLRRRRDRLPVRQRSWLAQMTAHPLSLYEIVDKYCGSGLVLRDRFRNLTVRVRDASGSKERRPSCHLLARVIRQPDGTPVIARGALEFQADARPRLDEWLVALAAGSGAAIDPPPHLTTLIRMWQQHVADMCELMEDAEATSDNPFADEFVSCNATFMVADRAAVIAALAARSDWRREEEGNDLLWRWFEGDGVMRCEAGRLSLYKADVLLFVESERRLALACAFLETIPGVMHERTERRSLEDCLADAALAEANAGKTVDIAAMTPEDRAALHRDVANAYAGWADECDVMLQGRTPREMVQIDPMAVSGAIWRICQGVLGKACDLTWLYGELGLPRLGQGRFEPGIEPVDRG
jgi:hypothetical protein